MGLAAFATMTLLTKNSFLEELRKQYVLTARAKGCSERQVLYGHIFRNAMLLVIAGFPSAFVSAFFAGSLLIETIFSLDGLGLLSFESVLNRDYPVGVRQSLYLRARRPRREPDFRSDLHLDRSAHRFRDARGVRWTTRPAPTTSSRRLKHGGSKRRGSCRIVEPTGPSGPHSHAAAVCAVADQQTTVAEFQDQSARLLVVVDFPRSFRRHAVCRIHRQRQTALYQLRRQVLFSGCFHLSGDHLRRRLRDCGRLPRSLLCRS